MKERREFTLDRIVRGVIWIALVCGVVWLLNTLKDVLLPFLVACLISYMCEPLVQYNRRMLKLKGRGVAVIVTLFEAVTLVGIAGYFLVPSIIEEFQQMGELLRRYASEAPSQGFIPEAMHDLLKRNVDFEQLAQTFMEQNMDSILDSAMTLFSGGLHVIIKVVSWLIVVLYVVFIMMDYEKIMRGFKVMVPPRFRRVAFRIGGDMKNSMNHYFRGQALISCCVAVVYCVGFLLSGLPMAVVLGLLTGVLFMVPYCQYLSIIPVTLLCIVDSANGNSEFWPQWWCCMATFAAVQVIGDLVLMPKIMGKEMGLNPAVILLSLSIWGSLLGFIGLIIALPLTTLMLAYYEDYVILAKRGRRDRRGETSRAER